ncbi:hypothetical protein LJK87_21000 [Paenibacillus sp. P25]|nr:hypothetical protein LJK87_21000 [Paenibacillus sp. P25]
MLSTRKRLLRQAGVSCRVLNMHTIKPLDEEAVLRAARETGRIITVEEHSIFGGSARPSRKRSFSISRCRCALSVSRTNRPLPAKRRKCSSITGSARKT